MFVSELERTQNSTINKEIVRINYMNLLTIEHLTKSYTERLLFNDTAFSINEGEKVGLIGINGTGKSACISAICPRSRNLPLEIPFLTAL